MVRTTVSPLNITTCFSEPLLSQEIWSTTREQPYPHPGENVRLHYDRARSLCKAAGLSIADIRDLSPRFWQFHFDRKDKPPRNSQQLMVTVISARDMTAFIIATIHLNLCIGTIASFAAGRPDLSALLDDLLCFKTCGEFMLTELGHGLDARNLETTATLLPNGCFDLDSPGESAWKAMPPTTPQCGMPRVAVVFARLIVDSNDRGIKPFIVKLCSAQHMCQGITSRVLPTRLGTKPLDHAITSFHHVLLPPGALLGSTCKPDDARLDFSSQIWRVSVGTLSLSIMGVSAINLASNIALTYSRRRVTSAGSSGERIPILQFSTQKRPIVKGLVSSIILKAFANWTIDQFMSPTLVGDVRRAIATVFKATVMKQARVLTELSERCGWQGLYAFNQISELLSTFLGNTVAEGDTLVLCIRLASELLGNKYTLPEPRDPTMPLAVLEKGLFEEARRRVQALGGYEEHRKTSFDKHILPRSRALIEAVGSRMAYEAARDDGTHPAVLRLYECESMGADLSWFTEHTSMSRGSFFDSISAAYEDAFPVVQTAADFDNVDKYITAPIRSEESWSEFMGTLHSFEPTLCHTALTLSSKL
ncbi:acyloxidase [Pochonia chlamydosporia 170]|uniref:Acyloxidase n=1 Tax=Pochonia chlamydosporia 170 TaxID=1380566 RepID=A0A179F0U0_METCM|nr:acyloxidase [Pochonia chlamydosporia 170]OAQ59041.1 acyloxidase [Pochonia chlamydosporia 170]